MNTQKTNSKKEQPGTSVPQVWSPAPNSTFQIQLSDYPPNIDLNADIYELDLFETSTNTIQFLQNNGKKVICYFNAGAWEEYRPDAADFPSEIIGNPYIGWPGERWLDIRNFKTFAHRIEARLDLAVEKGCNAVDPDNINGYQQPTGFEITSQDQLEYNIWLAEQAHARGLAIGMKNDGKQVDQLEEHFDFAVIEDCAIFSECAQFHPFIEHGKAVFQLEYTDFFSEIDSLCHAPQSNGFFVLLKNRSLDAFVQYCEGEI